MLCWQHRSTLTTLTRDAVWLSWIDTWIWIQNLKVRNKTLVLGAFSVSICSRLCSKQYWPHRVSAGSVAYMWRATEVRRVGQNAFLEPLWYRLTTTELLVSCFTRLQISAQDRLKNRLMHRRNFGADICYLVTVCAWATPKAQNTNETGDSLTPKTFR